MSNDYRLSYGTHATPEHGRCAMEWVSYLAGEPHGDHPACVSPVVRAFCTTLNDSLEDEPRQRLRPYLARTIGTGGDGFDETRSWLAMDWLTRTYVPRWLVVAGLNESADHIAGLGPLLDGGKLQPALDALAAARRQTRATWTATLGTPRAWAPWAAGRAAAREAAWSSAGAAAWAAARVAAGDIAGDRIRATAREIAGDSAATVARGVRSGTGRAAVRTAVMTALGPTLEELRTSALGLLDRMLPTVPLALPVVEDAELVCGIWSADIAGRDLARR
jgi:hypothetical protein